MKNLLTIVAYAAKPDSDAEYEGIDFIYPEEGESEKNFLTRAIKGAKGKYTFVSSVGVRLADIKSILNVLDKNNADIVNFAGGAILKTSDFKSVVKDCPDAFSLLVLAALECKTTFKTLYAPFTFERARTTFTDDNTDGMLLAASEFKKAKAKLQKEIYSYVFDLLCLRIIDFYLYAMLEIRAGRLESEKLIEFDNKLKAEIVMYLAVEKRFTFANLDKLRSKGFKISYFTAKKFEKRLK